MIGISGDSKIYIFTAPTDMRKSFHGLSKVVYDFDCTPHSGAYYVFLNKPKNKVKILYWDGDGFAMWYKALQEGQFSFKLESSGKISVTRRELTMILEGVEPKKMKHRFTMKKG